MEGTKVSKLLQFYEHAKAEKQPWIETWEELSDYLIPRKSDMYWTPGKRGKRQGIKVYDTTGRRSLMTAAGGMQGYGAPESGSWFELGLPIKDMEDAPGIRSWLQDTTDGLYSELSRGDFYHALAEATPNVMGLGSGTVYTYDHPASSAVFHETLHPAEITIARNRHGIPDTHFWRHWVPLDDIVEEYGEDAPSEVRDRAKNTPYEEEEILIIVMPRKNRELGKIDNLNKPYATYHIHLSSQTLMRESGFDDNPFTTGDWTRNSGETYGRGWGEDALPDIMRINQIAKALLLAAHLAVNPPKKYPAELEGFIDLDPGGMNPYQDPNRVIERIDLLGEYPVARDQENDIREAIREQFMVPFFVSLQQLQQTKPNDMTATQVLEMQGEKAAILSTVTGNWYSGLVTPMMVKTWRRAYWAGRMPEIPDILRQYGVTGLKIDFIGPLAQIQKRFHAFHGLQQSFAQFMPFTATWPEMLKIIDPIELGKYILREGGAPQKIIKDDRAIQAALEAMAQQAASAGQAQNLSEMSKAIPALGKAPEPGSPLEAMTQSGGAQK